MRLRQRIRNFFIPPAGSSRWAYILPYGILIVLGLVLLAGGTYGWEYTNSPTFCGYACHTMPPQNATYLVSPHSKVYCTECHIGRAFVGEQFARKSEDLREIYAMVFHTYEYPIRATRSRPARETCEQCHQPETFSDDSLRTIHRFGDDPENTLETIYLVMKTGGGAKREGLGKGIHWHIGNKVEYYSTDTDDQTIPYVRVTNDDGTTTEYVDVESGVDPASIDESQLKEMDCLTCHNRVTHDFKTPKESVDEAMARGTISPEIPDIHLKAVEVLSAKYTSHDQAMAGIEGLTGYYQATDYYAGHEEQVSTAIATLKEIYSRTVFSDQKVDWTTHPKNLGHFDSPGCFRCHDGKHLDADQQAIRLECNLCHAIPVVAGAEDFVTNIEISRGPEPESHLNPNWISLHNQVFNDSCTNCHTTEDPGGTSNTSFCSNSACHGNVFTYAGFDAPALREILKDQLPPPPVTATPAPVVGAPTFDANIGPLLAAKCILCHGDSNPPAGLSFTTYEGIMQGAEDGPVIVPGDSAASKLVEVQSGQHFGKLSAEELALVKEWIDAGAPEE